MLIEIDASWSNNLIMLIKGLGIPNLSIILKINI